MTLIIACGLRREARLLERPGRDLCVIVGGGDVARLEHALDDRAAACPGIILSCGIAGALTPALRSGDLVIDGDAALVDHLRWALPHAMVGGIVGRDIIVATAREKRALAGCSGAIAVDMESHVARRVARRRQLPVAAIRAIADGADDDLPPAALVGMRPDGGLALGAVLRSLVRQPGQLAALIRTGRQADQALRSLSLGFDALIRAGVDRLDPAALSPA